MNYQYSDDGTQKTYTVNGTVYHDIKDVPEEHRAYFLNIDKNNNGIPDKLDPLMDALNGNAGVGKVLGALFKTVKNEMSADDIGFDEVKEEKKLHEPVQPALKQPYQTGKKYDKGAVQKGESSFATTLFVVLIVGGLIAAAAWYFGLLGF
jgi:hypothetical protein